MILEGKKLGVDIHAEEKSQDSFEGELCCLRQLSLTSHFSCCSVRDIYNWSPGVEYISFSLAATVLSCDRLKVYISPF